MTLCLRRLLAFAAFVCFCFATAQASAQYAYITNYGSGTVSVIDTTNNQMIGSPIAVGGYPLGVAVTPDGSKVYVTSFSSSTPTNTVSMIDTTHNNAVTTITVGSYPYGVAVTPDGSKAYVTDLGESTVSVIDTATNAVTTITGFNEPTGVTVTPDGSKAYVTNLGGSTVSVIDTATNAVSQINLGGVSYGVAVTPDGSKVYVADGPSGNVSVIDTATHTVSQINLEPSATGLLFGVAVTPDGSKVYVTDNASDILWVIDTATHTVSQITVGIFPAGVAVTLDGSKVYVANDGSNTVSVIDTATNAVTTTISGFSTSISFGIFIPQTIPFSSLSATLAITGGSHPTFALNAFFSPGAGSTGINPPAQPVTLHVGPYAATIPAGSFHQLASGPYATVWAFYGTINNVSLAVDILSFGHNSYQFGAAADPVNLNAVANPVPVLFSIGNNAGSTSVNATRLP